MLPNPSRLPRPPLTEHRRASSVFSDGARHLNNHEPSIKTKCVQVLACDPDDVIVADPSSTKAGVAVMMELGASSSARLPTPHGKAPRRETRDGSLT